MTGHTCYQCKAWVEKGEAHDCWTTTESALTRELGEDLREAWERLRDTAAGFGEQRIYASHNSVMFSRKTCYFYVRPKRRFLELNVLLDRTVQAPQVKRVIGEGKRRVHVIQVRHRDEVEAPITNWPEEAYWLFDAPAKATPPPKRTARPKRTAKLEGQAQALMPAGRSRKISSAMTVGPGTRVGPYEVSILLPGLARVVRCQGVP